MEGVLLYAHDNGTVDYAALAHGCAAQVRKHLNTPIALVTDQETKDALDARGALEIFDLVQTTEVDRTVDNWRLYSGDGVPSERGRFLNQTRMNAFEDTPFDETLVMDTDFLVFSDRLNQVWESPNSFMMNRTIDCLQDHHGWDRETMIEPLSIPQYWATVFYFRKDDEARLFFQTARHVVENYEYYAMIYRFSPGMIRVDHVFSVAAHLLSGFGAGQFVEPLPGQSLLFAWDKDVVRKVYSDGILFESVRGGESFPIRLQDQDVHVLNKRSLVEHIEALT